MRQRRLATRALVPVAAAAACLAFSTPAWASSDVHLKTAHTNVKAGGFEVQECNDERFDNLPADHDGWHFVLPSKEAGNFEELTLTFSDNGGESVIVKVPDAGDPYPDDFYKAGDQVKHAYVFTPAGWTLVSGSATISGTAKEFELSHTCAGTTPSNPPSNPPNSESPAPSETPTSPGETPTSPGDKGDKDDNGGLPVTGAAATTLALLGVALVGGGATMVALRRRRDNVTFTS